MGVSRYNGKSNIFGFRLKIDGVGVGVGLGVGVALV